METNDKHRGEMGAWNSSKVMCYSVGDDPKLPDDSGEVPKLNGVVSDSIPG
jgi:hypothetical protein